MGDTLELCNVHNGMDCGEIILVNKTTGDEIVLSCSFSERQKEMLPLKKKYTSKNVMPGNPSSLWGKSMEGCIKISSKKEKRNPCSAEISFFGIFYARLRFRGLFTAFTLPFPRRTKHILNRCISTPSKFVVGFCRVCPALLNVTWTARSNLVVQVYAGCFHERVN